MYNRNKYHAKKTVVDGIEFASKKEANRYCELRLLVRAGVISNLELQKKYTLVPSFRRSDGKLERALDYVADFVYEKDGKTIVEDTKGCTDTNSAAYRVFAIKRKLMKFLKDIEIQEV